MSSEKVYIPLATAEVGVYIQKCVPFIGMNTQPVPPNGRLHSPRSFMQMKLSTLSSRRLSELIGTVAVHPAVISASSVDDDPGSPAAVGTIVEVINL